MFGQKAFNSINDIKINTIDYKWLQNCEKPSHLKRALKVLHEDGNHNLSKFL